MIKIPDEYIAPLDIAGLKGRMLKLPARDDRDVDILLIYGLHSSQERMYTTAQFHSRYGNVWAPDLPGFGGMDSFFKIDREPDLDTYADYLHTLMRTHQLDKRKIRVVAMSFGFLVVTRMLQKYPKMVKNMEFVVSFVGFGKTSDFSLDSAKRKSTRQILNACSTRAGGAFIGTVFFNKISLRAMFAMFEIVNPNPKYKRKDSKQAQAEAIEMELDLWSTNDARTKFYTYKVLADFDLTKDQKPIELSLHDMTTPADQYFNNKAVSKTLSKLYEDSSIYVANMKMHAPSVIGDEEMVANIYPDAIKKILDS